MKPEQEIKAELQYWVKQGFLQYGINLADDCFINGYITALKFVLDENESK